MTVRRHSPTRPSPASLAAQLPKLGAGPRARPQWLRVLVALGLPVMALLVTLGLTRIGGIAPHVATLLLLVSVALSAWFGGARAGMISALFAVVLVTVVLTEPRGRLDVANPSDLFEVALFILSALIVTQLNARLQDSRLRINESARQAVRLATQLEEKAGELERRVAETNALTLTLEERNAQLESAAQEIEAARDDAELERTRLKRVLDALPDSTIAFDGELRYTYMNPQAARWLPSLGLELDQVLGRHVFDVRPGLRGTEFDLKVREAMREGRVAEYVQYQPALGIYLETRIVPTEQGVVSYSRDVSERIRHEEEQSLLGEASRVLAASLDYETTVRGFARLAVPALGDACCIDLVEADGAVRRVHAHGIAADIASAPLDALCRVLGDLASEQWRDHPITRALRDGEATLVEGEALARFLFDEGGTPLREVSAMLSVPLAARGRVVGVVSFLMLADGRRFDARRVATAAEVARRAAIAIDNAELFAAEQAARRASEENAERTRRLQRVTAALGEADTIERVADVIITHGVEAAGADSALLARVLDDGLGFEAVRQVGYPEPLATAFLRFPLSPGRPMSDATLAGEIVVVESREDAAERYAHELSPMRLVGAEASASLPIRTGERAVACLCFNFRSPTRLDGAQRSFLATLAQQCAQAMERARLFEAERRARADAEAASRAKTDFLATMSHELRTPLNAIAGYTELLELELRGPITPEQREDLQRIRRSQRYLLALINDVLNFAKVESGHVRYDIGNVRLDDTLAGLETLVAPQLRDKGIAYDYRRVDPGVEVSADREKLEQIILNLLSNAVKFTERGGRITLSCEPTPDQVHVRVHDTGRGIPQDRLDAIFEPFVQVERGLTRTTEGTGLGLAISRDLARAMGGDLTASSVAREGSTFTLTLPRPRPARAAPARPAEETGHEAATRPRGTIGGPLPLDGGPHAADPPSM